MNKDSLVSILSSHQNTRFIGTTNLETNLCEVWEETESQKRFELTPSLKKKILHYAKYAFKTQANIIFDFIVWEDEELVPVPYHIRQIEVEYDVSSRMGFVISKKTNRKLVDVLPKMDTNLMDSLNDVILISESEPVDKPGPRVMYVNHAFERMTGFSQNEIIGKTPRILHGDLTESSSRKAIREGLDSWKPIKIEVTNYKKNGDPFIVELNINPMTDATGWFTHWISVQRDISSRKENEMRLKTILDNFPGAVYQFKRSPAGEFSFSYLGAKAYEFYGVTPQELEKKPNLLLELVHPDDALELANMINESANKLEVFHWTGRILLRSGEIKWIDGKSSPTVMEDGTIVWNGILKDVTKNKLMEIQLKEQHALESHNSRLTFIGEIAAGIGHEIRNPMAIANGQIEMIKKLNSKMQEPNQDIEKCVAKYQIASKRIDKIVDGLRILSRKSNPEFSTFDSVTVTAQVFDFLKELYTKDGIEMSRNLPQSAILMTGDDGWLQQCLINLFANAKDAIETSETKKIDLSMMIAENDKTLSISVRDYGIGIDPAIKKKIFDPFFTTKGPGKGTGIGLSTTMELSRQMEGRVEVYSHPVGTEFKLIFPVAILKKKEGPHSQRRLAITKAS